MTRRLPPAISILVAPRETMRALLESPKQAATYLVLALALVSTVISDFDGRDLGTLRSAPLPMLGVVAGVMLGVLLAALVTFQILAFVALHVGRQLDGVESRYRDVASALAWGLAPLAWALVVRVPLLIERLLHPAVRKAGVAFDPGMIANGCSVALLTMLFKVAIIAWVIVVSSATLAEAFRFSVWRGLGTFALTMVSPLVVIAAALLAAH